MPPLMIRNVTSGVAFMEVRTLGYDLIHPEWLIKIKNIKK